MIVPLFHRSGALQDNTSYHFFGGYDGTVTSTPGNYETVIPFTATLKNLYVYFTVGPGTGNSRTFTVYKNGSSTSLAVTVSGSSISGSDTSNTVSLSAGDRIYLESTAISNPANGGFLRIYAELETTDRYLVSGVASASFTGTKQIGVLGSINDAVNNNSETVPHDCTLQEIYFTTATAPGTGNSMTFKVFKNGLEEASATTTISDTATQATKTSVGLSFTQGDRIYIETTDNSGAGTPVKKWNLGFQPSTSNETAIYSYRFTNPSTSVTNYYPLSANSLTATNANDNRLYAHNSNITFNNLFIRVNSSIGSAPNSYDVTLLDNGSDTSLTASLNGATTASDTVNSVSATSGNHYQFKIVPVSSPTARVLDISMVATVSGGAPPVTRRVFNIS